MESNWKLNGSASSARHLEELMHVVNAADIAEKDWWVVFKIPANRVQPTGASIVRHEVLRAFRIWSRYFHPDRFQNSGLGLPFQHRLNQRLIVLNEKKDSMQIWYDSLAVDLTATGA